MATAALRNEGCRRAPPSGRRNVIGRRAPMSRPALMRRRDGQGGPAAPGPSRRASSHRPRCQRLWVPAVALAGRQSLRGLRTPTSRPARVARRDERLRLDRGGELGDRLRLERGDELGCRPCMDHRGIAALCKARILGSWACDPLRWADRHPPDGGGARLGWALSSRGCVVGATQGRPTRLS
jgi:hypothetical protein